MFLGTRYKLHKSVAIIDRTATSHRKIITTVSGARGLVELEEREMLP